MRNIPFVRAALAAAVLAVPVFARADDTTQAITTTPSSGPPDASATPVQPVETAVGRLTFAEFMFSTVMQEHQSAISGIGARVRLHPQRLIDPIELMPTFEYWRSSNEVQPYGVHTVRRDATLGVDMRYNFSNKTFRPYAGVGWGLHFLSSEIDAPSLGVVDQSSSLTKGAVSFLGGMSFPLTERFANFIDLKYHWVTDYNQLKLNWGLAYSL